MVMVPVPGPPQVPGAVGQTSAAPDSWMVKVAVLTSARAPPAVRTAPTADRAMVMIRMVTSRLPIEPPSLGPDVGIRLLPTETAVPVGWLRSSWARSARPQPLLATRPAQRTGLLAQQPPWLTGAAQRGTSG